ncbi:MAG: VOC family protein [Chloroflexi bacterium]|nr:VOC family protein [Chloroflexota bacterium]
MHCRTQAELEGYWDKFFEGGKAVQCGWLTDEHGLA